MKIIVTETKKCVNFRHFLCQPHFWKMADKMADIWLTKKCRKKYIIIKKNLLLL